MESRSKRKVQYWSKCTYVVTFHHCSTERRTAVKCVKRNKDKKKGNKRYNISAFKCLKATRPLSYILSSCVLTISQMFPKMFNQSIKFYLIKFIRLPVLIPSG